MLNLIRNENMKIYLRVRTWVLVAILVGLTCTALTVFKHVSDVPKEDWRTQTQRQINSDERSLETKDLPAAFKDQLQKNILVGEYRLARNIPPAEYTLWGGISSMAEMIQLVTIFVVVIAGDIVASEFAGGTIKLLLIRPFSRSKILLSKYFATILFSVFLLGALFGTAFAASGILFGFSSAGTSYVYAGNDFTVHEGSMLFHVLATYGLKSIELVMIVTMAFMISTAFRSSSLAIGISMMTLFLGRGVTLFLSRYSWGKYWLFANTDLTQYLDGRPHMEGMSMPFSIAVLLLYFLLFNILSWSIFNKRDVAA